MVQVLYNLFEWPMRKGSRLAVIGIANTMDLPERFLPRIASRLSGSRIVFQPYTRQQLATIVTTKLEGHGLKHTIAANAIGHACSKARSCCSQLALCRGDCHAASSCGCGGSTCLQSCHQLLRRCRWQGFLEICGASCTSAGRPARCAKARPCRRWDPLPLEGFYLPVDEEALSCTSKGGLRVHGRL